MLQSVRSACDTNRSDSLQYRNFLQPLARLYNDNAVNPLPRVPKRLPVSAVQAVLLRLCAIAAGVQEDNLPRALAPAPAPAPDSVLGQKRGHDGETK
jgi:hypothetical protein